MKKWICSILTFSMVIGMSVSAYATQTITFNENNEATVTTDAPATDTPATSTPAKDDSSKENGIGSVLDSIFGGANKDSKEEAANVKGYLALGQDLTSDQLATVLALLGIDANDLGSYSVVYTTNAEEHQYLDKYISSSVIGTKSLSSVLVKPASAGHGVVVTTKNINYCTDNMYRNALITAGVTDADITVAAPTSISGTAALIGALKAYEKMSGKPVSQNAVDTSLNELVTTGQISEAVGSGDQAEEFIAYIKTVVATNDLNTKEEIEAAIRKGMKDLNVTLSEEEIAQTVDLMMKIKAMGIDYSVLVEQADDIYAKYKDDINAGTFDISKVDLNDAGIKEILANALSNSLKDVGESIKGFFGKIFGN